MKKTRIQFDLPNDRVEQLERLMAATDIDTRKDLFNNALALFEWAVAERQRGYEIGSYSTSDKEVNTVHMPSLISAARNHPRPWEESTSDGSGQLVQ